MEYTYENVIYGMNNFFLIPDTSWTTITYINSEILLKIDDYVLKKLYKD